MGFFWLILDNKDRVRLKKDKFLKEEDIIIITIMEVVLETGIMTRDITLAIQIDLNIKKTIRKLIETLKERRKTTMILILIGKM